MITLCPGVAEFDCRAPDESSRAFRIMLENGFALRNSPKNRGWLREQKKQGQPFAGLSNNQLIELVEELLEPIARDTATAIVRMYRILDSKEFKQAMALYPDEE